MALTKGFSEETRQAVYGAQNGRCKICVEPIVDFHHKLPNTKINRKLFPLFINSVFNCAGLSRDCHTNKSYLFKVTEKEAQMYENWLKKLANR